MHRKLTTTELLSRMRTDNSPEFVSWLEEEFARDSKGEQEIAKEKKTFLFLM